MPGERDGQGRFAGQGAGEGQIDRMFQGHLASKRERQAEFHELLFPQRTPPEREHESNPPDEAA